MSEFIYDPDNPVLLAQYVKENLWDLHPGKQVSVLLSFDNDRRLIEIDTLEIEDDHKSMQPVWDTDAISNGWDYVKTLLRRNGATNWMIAHNHDTAGTPRPSPEDSEFTVSCHILGMETGIHFRGHMIVNRDATAVGVMDARPKIESQKQELDDLIANVEEKGESGILRLDDDEVRENWIAGAEELYVQGLKIGDLEMSAMLREMIEQVRENHCVDLDSYKRALGLLKARFDDPTRHPAMTTPEPPQPQQPQAAQAANPFELPKLDVTKRRDLLN